MPRATIRMYRQGMGDCFVLRFPKAEAGTYTVMIDCGVMLGQDPKKCDVGAVFADVAKLSGGVIDLLVATHEHWDHISGFVQAWENDGIPGITVRKLWLAWTEDRTDPLAQRLARQRDSALMLLAEGNARLSIAGNADDAIGLAPFLEQLGLSAASSTALAMRNIKRLTSDIRYCRPGDPPVELEGTGVEVFIFCPPTDEKLLRTLSRSPSNPVMYGLETSAMVFGESGAPFGYEQTLPIEGARRLSFFQEHYFGTDAHSISVSAPAWRRIDDAWLQPTRDLALQLDAYTNNTSLVLCFRFPNGETMLFPGDAQIGSWLSWPDLSWTVNGETVIGSTLLENCVCYKVSHHGSHNATPKEGGLEMMRRLKTVFIPVDEAEARKRRWNRMPLPAIVDALNARAPDGVVRADKPPSGMETSLYIEVDI